MLCGWRWAAWLMVTSAALLLFTGCSGARHLHPRTGKAYHAVLKAHQQGKAASLEMSGEDAEQAMANLSKKTKMSDFKQSRGNFLLPLQR